MKPTYMFPAIAGAAVLALANVVYFRLEVMMSPSVGMVETTGYITVALIVGLAIAAVWAASRRSLPAVAALVVCVLAVSFLPRAVAAANRDIAIRIDRSEGEALETALVAKLKERHVDVAARIATKRAYSADEAYELVMLVDDADLRWHRLADHTPEASALLEEALLGGIVDVNARGSGGQPLFLRFYDFRIKPTAPQSVMKREWQIEKQLVAHGADLADPAAAELSANLARKETPGTGRYIALE